MTDIINLINDIGQKNPDRVAIRHKSDELTYRQLIEESSKLAHYLQDTNKPLIIYDSWNDRSNQSRMWLCPN